MIEADFYQAPFAFFLLCFLLGASCFLVPYAWFGLALTGRKPALTPVQMTGFWLFRMLFLLALLLIFARLFYHGESFIPVQMLPEMLIVGFSLIFFFAKYYARTGRVISVFKAFLAEILAMAGQVAFIYTGFAAVIFSTKGAIFLFSFIQAPAWAPFFFIGISCLALLVFLDAMAQRKIPSHGLSFQAFLWPVVVGIVFFILPLLLERVMNSEKMREILNPPVHVEKI